MTRRIAVVGAGGVGGYFGARLAAAGHQVTFIARGATLEALRREGLFLESPLGDLHLSPVQATDDPASVGPVDLVLFGVKAWQVPEAARLAAPLVAADTVLLPLQNGVEAPAQLAAEHGDERVLGGLCKIISMVAAPGRIHHLGATPHIDLGELDRRPSERATNLVALLQNAGISARQPDDIHVALWEKFLFIASVSGVGAASRSPLGILREQPETRALLHQAMEEVHAVADARGVHLADDAVPRTLAFVDSLPADGTASMQRDIEQGRPSELESQNGAVVRLAAEAGVEVPVHRFLYACLLPQELAARGS